MQCAACRASAPLNGNAEEATGVVLFAVQRRHLPKSLN